MGIRTDLAVERLDGHPLPPDGGVKQEQFTQSGIEVTRVSVLNQEGAQAVGKPIGEYLTVSVSGFRSATADFEKEVEAVAALLRPLLRQTERGTTLVVGLGNRDITPDALGPKAVNYILATRHISQELAANIGLEGLRPVAAIATGVLGQTGIETAEIVAAVVNRLHPACVIVIDALAARSVDRLATTVQLSNTGISPGSGVQNKRQELSEQTLGVPVLSVGVPMVVDMATIAAEFSGAADLGGKGRDMMVTPREIDLAVEHAAKTVAFAVNRALQPELSLEEIMGLVG